MVTTNERQANWFTNERFTVSYLAKFYNTQTVLTVILLSLITLSADVRSELLTGTDEVAQLPYWEWRSDTISVRLVQRLPDQTRAYFAARGFSKEQAEMIAQSCVFQTVYKSVSPAGSDRVVEYDLSKWNIQSGGKNFKLKLREEWMEQWNRMGVSNKAKIAFNWSLLPTRQTYRAQDYNWGMTIYRVPPSTKFDLLMVWKENGKERTAIIDNIQCAPDIHIEPREPFG